MQSIDQKQIAFQGAALTAVMVLDVNGRENVYVPLKPLVEGMGLNWSGQRQRIKKNPVLNEVCRSVGVTHSEPNRVRNIEMLCIPISHLNGFLFGVNANRVKSEIRPLLIEYQANCYRALFEAFNGTEAMTRFYQAIGHNAGWIDARIQKHVTSSMLGDMWLINGIPIEYHDRLQDELSRGTFGVSTEEHRQLKSLPDDVGLRDNMTRIELIMSMYTDEANRLIIENEAPSGLDANIEASHRAGEAGGKALKNFEDVTGGKVVSDSNNLDKQLRSGE